MQCFVNLAEEGLEEPFVLRVFRKYLTNIRDSVLQDYDFVTRQLETEYYPGFNQNRNPQLYYVNDCRFHFNGLDDSMKAHGMKQDYSWINEGMEISKEEFDQVEMRTTRKIIIDYNPSDENHFIFELMKRDDVVVIKSTVLDNPFVEIAIREKILGYEPTPYNIARGTASPYMWEVYGLGNAAKLEGLVFENWDIVDSIPEGAIDLGIGLDFGFSNDPATAVEVYKYDKELYLNELFYEIGLINTSNTGRPNISQRLKALEIGSRPITADSSEPKSIIELRNDGWNIHGAVKGQDSVRFGIDLMNKFKIHITRKSINLERELRHYIYAKDKNGNLIKKNGKSVPIDEFNHAIDAARYRIMKKLGNKFKVRLYSNNVLG